MKTLSSGELDLRAEHYSYSSNANLCLHLIQKLETLLISNDYPFYLTPPTL